MEPYSAQMCCTLVSLRLTLPFIRSHSSIGAAASPTVASPPGASVPSPGTAPVALALAGFARGVMLSGEVSVQCRSESGGPRTARSKAAARRPR
jgi:hypothetical protein